MANQRLTPSLKQEALEKLLSVCPHCRAKYEQLDSVVITESKDAELVHVKCRSCQGSLVALLFSTGPLISSIGLVTDLSQEDVVRFQQAKELSEEDLLACHEWLRQPQAVADIINYRTKFIE
jgi:hypothetical protein